VKISGMIDEMYKEQMAMVCHNLGNFDLNQLINV
jgi:hypothetical protein